MNKILRVLVPLIIIAGGVVVLRVMVMTKPEPEKKERVNPGVLVETAAVTTKSDRVRVDAKGTVVAAREVMLSPEVSGRVSWMAAELVPGGRFTKGQLLVRLVARDYQLAVEQQYASVDRARTELKLEQARTKVAETEWELVGPGAKNKSATAGTANNAEPDEVVALREPQMRTAKVAVKAAESGLERAKLTVTKTTIRAPFNAMVRARQVEVGQLVGPSSPLATLVGTDAYWVQVSVPMDYLSWIRVPGVGASTGQGSVATITQTVGENTVERQGRVVRLLGDVDPVGRMARILVEIEDPLGLAKAGAEGTPQVPLLLGSYVQVLIEGQEVREVSSIPRTALRDGDRVYLRAANGSLEIRDVHVVWRRPSEVLVDRGLKAGEEVIVSAVATAVAGMKLRTRASASKEPAKAPPAKQPAAPTEVEKPAKAVEGTK